jgi:hypothetical protein
MLQKFWVIYGLLKSMYFWYGFYAEEGYLVNEVDYIFNDSFLSAPFS